MKKYERHFLSEIHGDMTEDEFQNLKDSITSIGVRTPIIIYDGQILDGWHRYRAATELGMPCPEEIFEGTEEGAIDISLANEARRHRSKEEILVSQFKARGWRKRTGPRSESAPGADLTSKEIAVAEGVSIRTVERAKVVARNAIPQVVAALGEGLGLKRAAEIATLPKKEQKKALTQKPKATPKRKPIPENLPRPVVGPTQEAYDELKERLDVLIEAYDALNDRIAVESMPGTDEERLTAAAIIADLRAELKTCQIELAGVKSTRNVLMTENSELKQQIKMNMRERRAG